MCRPFLLPILVFLIGAHALATLADQPLPAIEKVEIRQRVFYVNGQPFFPLMSWLQDAKNLPAVKACGMNATAGYWPGSSNTENVAEYLTLVDKHQLYGVMPYDSQLHGRSNLLGYIHGDEPDLPRQVSDAEIVPGPQLRINRKTPLWKLVDGVTHSWSVLDPLAEAQLAVRLKGPVTVESLAIWLTVSPGLAVAKEVSFDGDGREIARATLKQERGRQAIPLDKPATFRELRLNVHSTYPGEQVWGSIGEIEGFGPTGENVLLSPPRYEPRSQPADTLKIYEQIKAADPSRPVLMTLTGNFHPHFGKWSETRRAALYPAYIRATDVIGYDIYPIYGWNKPEWIHLVHDATRLLADESSPRPVYAWIETSKGGQWTGPLERQKDVTPQHIRAETWMAICGGATAIGYFTHVWKPTYHQFGVPDQNRAALRQINEQITRLTPAVLGDAPQQTVSIACEDDVRAGALAKLHGGCLYVFAVNFDSRLQRTNATISITGLPAATKIEVVDEDRSLTAQAGSFADVFEPLAVHVYRVPLDD
jgi:hypothetical protein